ncbi:central kinetochore subunit Mis15/CHL4 [Geosmithia morbida]|uniref:Central kinetochore subunit Mis15/CHL4 n=1 Tax=Geosmithia morbida TaxID=1094350 RepID=A0A9P4Z0D0_9HYPO|nr:central kinetochore subunit Mis15/CHL4 [Geosmithia morbida]KAF4125832.1 central kinetochore subunit Mis15/CHL4 [Geosmithia morbida]
MPPRISVPTKARLPSTLRVDASNPAVIKCMTRLSRDALISLALDWLDDTAVQNAIPYLRRPGEDGEDDDDMDDLYPASRTVEELRQTYEDMRQQRGSKRDVVSRMLEGDWRHGMTLYQLAMADLAYFDEHPTSQRWSAYRILPLQQPNGRHGNADDLDPDDPQVLGIDRQSLKIPRFHPATFLQTLQEQVLPDVKAHYHFYRPESFPVLLLRIFVVDSPYSTDLALSSIDQSGSVANFETSRTIYLAFPDGSPSLYISKSHSTGPVALGDSRSLQSLVVDGVPKALSRPRERFTLKSTSLSSRNLWALLDKKGPGKTNAAGGGWSIYANDKTKKSPLDSIPSAPPLLLASREGSSSAAQQRRKGPGQRERKRARLIAEARFGDSARVSDDKGVEKVEVVLQDPYPTQDDMGGSDDDDDDNEGMPGAGNRRKSKVDATIQEANQDLDDDDAAADESSQWSPAVKLTFNGPHVFAGIRQLIEAGIIDGQRMPGWMTGEEGVTTGVVRNGRIRGHKGSGM